LTVEYLIQFKRKPAASWIAKNPILAKGEPGFELDTFKMKIGDGVTAWTSLPYQNGLGVTGNLQNLTDVTLTSLATGDVLSYNSTSGKWVNNAGIATSITDLTNRITTLESITPSGNVQMTARSTAPSGWVLCDGASYLRTGTYANLFAAIGTTYGAADGTHFNVPNLKGKVPVGVDSSQTEFNALGASGGAKVHQLQPSEMPVHSHTGTTNSGEGSHKHWISGAAYDDGNMSTSGSSNTQDYGLAADAGSWTLDDPNKNYGRYSSTTGSTHQHTFTTQNAGGTAGVTQSHNNLQPYLAMNYIIKL
jgi:microcystin-dependent protein